MTAIPPHTENSYSSFNTQIQTPLFCDAPQCPVTFGASRTPGPSEQHPPTLHCFIQCLPPPHPGPGPSGGPSGVGGAVRVRPRGPALLELLPHPQTHTHTKKTTPLSANRQAPTDVYRLPPPRTPAPRPLPRSLGLPPPAPPAHKATPLACAPTNSGASDKARHPRARPAARTGQSPAGVGRRGPRAHPPREVLADEQAPAPSGAPRPAAAGPRPPLFPPEAPARSGSVLTASTRRARPASGGRPAPASPARTDTASGRAPGPPPRPRRPPPADTRPAAAAPRPPCRPAPCPAAGSAPRR